MILAEITTEHGTVYVADVVNKKIKKISKSGASTDWFNYANLDGGYVGNLLTITWPDGTSVKTGTVSKLDFPVQES